MSKTVDQRIVEMRFDNNQFEQNVKTSMGTLDKLKHALKLDGASKGLNDVSKASKGLNFSSIADSVESLSKRFSTMGIVGMQVITRMTDACINFATKGIGLVTSKIIEGGKRRAFNIENAHFQLQGLLKDEEKVQAVMADAMESVDGTAYAYDEAAKAASQFAASGLQAGEQMLSALRGITGVAAMTNSEYEGISRIFTTVAGNGRIMGEQLLQLSSRGLNAASTLADFFNGVKDGSIKANESVTKTVKSLSKGAKTTEADIRGWVSKSKISFEVFAAAMDDAFGEHAKRANETFNGAMANMGAALSRIGAKFFSPLIEQNGELVQLFNTLRLRINDINKEMDPFAEMFTSSVKSMAVGLKNFAESEELSMHITDNMKKLQKIFLHLKGTIKQVALGIAPFLERIKDAFNYVNRDINSRGYVIDSLDKLGDAMNRLHNITTQWSKWINSNDRLLTNWRNTIRGVFSAFDILFQLIKSIVIVFAPANSEIKNCAEGMLTLTGGVGEWLTKLDESIKKNNTFVKALTYFKDTVINVFNTIINSVPGLRQFLSDLEYQFNNITSSDVIDFLNQTCDAIEALIQKVAGSDLKGLDLVKYTFDQMSQSAKDLLDSLKRGDNPLAKFIIIVKNEFVRAWEKVEEIIKKAKEQFNKFFEGLEAKETISGLFKAGGLIYALKLLYDYTQSIIKLHKKVGGFFGQLTENLKINNKFKPLIMFAEAIAILSGSLFLLSKIEPDRLEGAIGAITILIVELTALYSALQFFSHKKLLSNVKDNLSGLYSIVIAVGAMSFILAQVSKIPAEDAANGLWAIGVLMLEMAALSLVMGGIGKDLSKAAPGLKTMIIALYAIVGSLILLRFIDPDTIVPGLIGIVGILTALGVFAFAVKKLKLGDVKIDPSLGQAMLMMAGSIAILAIAIGILAKYNLEQIARGTVGVIGALIILVGAIRLIDILFKQIDTSKIMGAAIGMMMVAVAIGLLVPAIVILGAVPWENLQNGLKAVVAGIATLALALGIVSSSASTGQLLAAGAGIMMIAAAMNMLLPVILTFGLIKWTIIAQGIGLFLGALLGFAIVGGIANHAAIGLVALGTSLLMISTSIVIAGVGLSAIGSGLIQLSVGLATLALIGKAALPELVAMIKAFVTETLTMLPDILRGVAESIGAFLDTLLDNIIKLTPKISETFTTIVLGLIAVFTSCVPALVEGLMYTFTEVFRSLVTYTPVLAGLLIDFLIAIIDMAGEKIPALVHVIAKFFGNLIDAVLEEFKSMDITKIVETLKVVGIIGALMVAFAGLALLTPAAMAGVVGVGLVIAELSLVLAAIGKLAKIPGIDDLINGGADLLLGIGTAIGNFIGGIIGGVMNGIASKLPSIGQYLTDFMNNLQGFITGCANIDSGTLESAKTLADVIIVLTKASILDGLMRFFGLGSQSSLAGFGKELEKFGPHFKAYADSISGIEAGTVIASARAAESLAEMAKKLPNEGGALALFVGDNTLAKFAEGLVPFGEAMAEYSKAVDGKINESSVEASARAGIVISDMAKRLPNSGGILADWVGDNTLAEFAEGLIPFGENLAKYSKAVDGNINEQAVQASANAAQIISDMASRLPNSGGLLSKLIGDNTLSQFGKELEEFGPSLENYSNSLSNVDTGTLNASSVVIGSLIDMSNKLSNYGGLVGMMEWHAGLDTFGKSIDSFGKSFNSYYNNIAEINLGQVSGASEQLKKLIDLANALSGQDTSGLRNFGANLKAIGLRGVEQFVAAFKEAGPQINSAIDIMTGYVRNALNNQQAYYRNAGINGGQALVAGVQTSITRGKPAILSNIKSLGNGIQNTMRTSLLASTFQAIAHTNIINGLISGITLFRGNLYTEITYMCNEVINKLKNGLSEDKIKPIGKNIITYLINGLNEQKRALNDAVKNVCDAILDAFKANINPDAYSEIGVLIIQSITTGIQKAVAADESGNNALSSAITIVNSSIINAFRNGLKADIFVAIGKNIATGLTNGIKSGQASAEKAASDTANAVISAVKKAAGSGGDNAKYFESSVSEAIGGGLKSYSDAIEENSDNFTERLMESTKATYRAVCYILEKEFANGPVIKPVVDLSNVDSAIYTLQNEFGDGYTARLASSVNLMPNRTSFTDILDKIGKINEEGNRDVVGELKELRSDVDSLGESIGRLQIVMDTGTLVGEIAPSMDVQLGRLATLRARGV